MASRAVDVVARLQLRAEQFSSDTGRAFADLKVKAASAADWSALEKLVQF